MDKDKITNLIWVLVLVPVVFSIFGAIREAGLQGSPYWLLQMLKYFVFLALPGSNCHPARLRQAG